jgi:hypothetical protein
MGSATDSIKTLVSRFVGLPDYVRLEVTRRLLIWHDENLGPVDAASYGFERRKSFVDQFREEVEKMSGDGLQRCHPFT